MAAELPENGELQLGAVRLPRGLRVIPDGHGPVAWVTSTEVADPGPVWSALAAMHPRTGLVPVLLDADEGADAEDYFFCDPADPRQIDAADPAEVLADRWDDPEGEETVAQLPPFTGRRSLEFLGLRNSSEGPNSLAGLISAIAGLAADPERNAEFERLNRLDREEEGWPPPRPPRPAGEPVAAGRPFPGLAPAVRDRLSTAERTAALAQLAPARVGLVPAARPADVIAVTGWFATDQFQNPPMGVPAGAVLRSWEDRFGAQLLMLGPGADVWLLVDRPPRTRAAARPIAIEHWAFADEFCGEGRTSLDDLADALVDRPVWQFWWD